MEDSEKILVFSRLLEEAVGELVIVERHETYYPSKEMLLGIQSAKPNIVSAWHAGIIGNGSFGYDEPSNVFHFNSTKYISMIGLNSMIKVNEPFGISRDNFLGAGKIIENPIPNAYLRSYSRITSLTKIYVGATEIKSMLIQYVGGKKAPEIIEEITSSLR